VERKEIISEILGNPFSVSEEQRDAITSSSNFTRVITGAGKTETITRRVAYLLLVKGVDPSSIVAFTFTEKAAQSMKSRIYQRIEQVARAYGTSLHIFRINRYPIEQYAILPNFRSLVSVNLVFS
jgi:superfamily I DNA/RNA helicase